MINKGFIKVFVKIACIYLLHFFILGNVDASMVNNPRMQDSAFNGKNTPIDTTKNTSIFPDSLKTDSVVANNTDSAQLPTQAKSDIDDPVKYSAKDSLYFDMENKTVHLYGEAKVTYQKIELTAAYIEFNMADQTVYASGVPDSTGEMTGYPHFKEGEEEFDARWLRYNFKSKKGFVYFVKSKQSDGTIIGDSTKRNPDGQIHLKGAKYSTCDLDHPHFYLRLTKAKAVPDDKIVSGPAYLVVADIPLPLIIPFGFFPNTKGFSSGLLMPTWGEERARGFYISRGGYYFAISDYIDGQLTGDIYSKGSWGANVLTNYKYRYKFGGSFNYTYYKNVIGEKGIPGYGESMDYRVRWNHTQDAKANPNVNFSANVNLSSTSYDKNNSRAAGDYLTNTRSSSISYSRRWPTSPFNLSTSLNHSQNSRNKEILITLPNAALNMNPIYPFRKEESTGDMKWYEDVQINYNASLRNEVRTYDSLFLTNRMWDNTKNGIGHSLSPSINFKITRFINLTPSLRYEGNLYSQHVKYIYNPTKLGSDGILGSIDTIEFKEISYAHAYYPAASLGYSPKLYGMYMFKNSRVKALRHVMSPNASLSYRPDVSSFVPQYTDTVRTRTGQLREYSIYEGSLYSTPTPTKGQSAVVSFGLRNNFEMKYTPKSDTASKDNKLTILRNLDFSGSYDLLADSFNLSDISMTTGTSIFNDKFDIQISANYDPYKLDIRRDTLNKIVTRRLPKYLWNTDKKLARLKSASMSIGTSFRSSEGKGEATNSTKKNTSIDRPLNRGMENDFDDDEINFDIPWSASINYTWGYSKPANVATITQSVSVSGDLSLTPKWKIGYSTGYDFTSKEFTYSRFNISRDLHCWEMRFDWVPFGYRTSYNFTINARGMLQDLKYTKDKPWRDTRN